MNLLSTLPAFWQQDDVLQAIHAMIQPEIDRLETLKNDVLKLGAVDGSSTWALNEWETAFGISPDVSNSDTFRSSSVQAKMRGIGILSPASLKEIMASYYGGDIEVIERPNERAIILKFVDQRGTPQNISAIKTVLDATLPVDLTYEFEYTYLLLDEVAAMTLEELSSVTLDNFAGGTMYVQ